MARWVRRAALVAVGWLALSGTASALPFNEVGDAPDHTNPHTTVGSGSLSSIHGSLQPLMDIQDAFRFTITGGLLQIRADFNADGSGLNVALFDGAGADVTSGFEAISASDLPAGSYIVEVGLPFDHVGSGPAFYTIFMTGSGICCAAPEPGTFALAALVLAVFVRIR